MCSFRCEYSCLHWLGFGFPWHAFCCISPIVLVLQTAARVQQLEQYVQQLQQEASTAGALEYRCEGLQQEKQQLAQQLQQLKGM